MGFELGTFGLQQRSESDTLATAPARHIKSSVPLLGIYYYGASSDLFLHILYGGPLRSVYLLTIWGPPQVSFFVYYIPPSGKFLCLHMGGPQISFFAYYMRPPSDQFLRLLYGGGPLSSLNLLYGAPMTILFFYFLRVNLSLGAPYFIISRGGMGPRLPPPPLRAPMAIDASITK